MLIHFNFVLRLLLTLQVHILFLINCKDSRVSSPCVYLYGPNLCTPIHPICIRDPYIPLVTGGYSGYISHDTWFFKNGLSALVIPIFLWLQLDTGSQPECPFSDYRYLCRGTAFPTLLHRRLRSDFVDQPGHLRADCAV